MGAVATVSCEFRPTLNQRKFLAAFASAGNVSAALEAAGLSAKMHWTWMRDPGYAALFAEAEQAAARTLEDACFSRARDGVRRPVLHQGRHVTLKEPVVLNGETQLDDEGNPRMREVPLYEHEYSDGLAMFLLKGLKPGRYRDNVSVDNRFVDSEGRDLVTMRDLHARIINLRAEPVDPESKP